MDVKAIKATFGMKNYDPKFTVIEKISVNGRKGYCYAEHLDFLVFDIKSHFLFIERSKMEKFIAIVDPLETLFSIPNGCIYQKLSRNGRNDIFFYAPFSDLIQIAFGLFPKHNIQ